MRVFFEACASRKRRSRGVFGGVCLKFLAKSNNFLLFLINFLKQIIIKKFLNISFFLIIAQSVAACQVFDNIFSNNKISRCLKNPPYQSQLLYIYQTQLIWVQCEAHVYFCRHMPKKSPSSVTVDIYITTAHDKGDKT